jgi:cyclopropane fatty-acyl-phospholipid synthase-like methyltransferase
MAVLMGGFAASQMLYVAARLKLADHLAHGPLSFEDLAAECGAKAPPLRRMVRALASFGVFEICGDGRVANTSLSECIRAGAHGSMRETALLYGEEHYHAMSELLQAVKLGGTAFEHAYRKPHFSYLASNPDAAHAYYEAAAAAAAQAADEVVDTYDFAGAEMVVDVGGGDGALVRAVLRANPRARGLLVETAGMARRARARVRAEGLDARCEVQTGDIFEAVPRDGDLYLVGHVLHLLDDERAAQVLVSCRRAMSAGARLLVIERLVPDQPDTNLSAQRTFVSDAVALAVSGGRERTLAEHTLLLSAAGLKVLEVLTTALGDGLLEAARKD